MATASSGKRGISQRLSSPRIQRRLLNGSGAVLFIGLVAFLAASVFRGTGNAFTDTFSNKPASVYHPEKAARLSGEEIKVARRFIATAVLRKNLDASYSLVHADLKGTMTRKQWDTGNIPVIQYPARNVDKAGFTIDYSYTASALLEVDLVAKRGSGVRPELTFFIGLKRAGGTANGRWLVNYWEPHWRPPMPAKVS